MLWTLIDVSWMAHRALHTGFSDSPTGIMFSVLEQIRAVANDQLVKSNMVMICQDSPESIRREMYPEYKNRRRHDRPVSEIEKIHRMREQMKRLTSDILPGVGFKVYSQPGLESDDMMAQAARQLDGEGCIMITSDSDLYQCITTRCHWYDPGRRKHYDHLTFWAAYGIDPQDWAEVKAIAGCETDNVDGIPGIGITTAVKYLTGGLKNTSSKYRSIVSPQGQAIIERNRKLVTLPHEATLPLDLVQPVYNQSAFWSWCDKLGLKSLLRDRRSLWEAFFDGRMELTLEQRQLQRARLRKGTEHG